MLKPFIERSNVETHSVSLVVSECKVADCEESDIEEHSDCCIVDYSTSKLKNSDVLKNMGTKLSHLVSDQ